MKQSYKNNSELNSSKSIEKANNSLSSAMLKDSEIIVKNILEKIISLSISEIYKRFIDRNISSFCIKELKKKIFTVIGIQFINHDQDDLKQRKIKKNKSHKIILYKNNKNNNNLTTEENKRKRNKLSKSQIIPSYELYNDFNYFESKFFTSKKILNILTRKNEAKSNYIASKDENENLMLIDKNNKNNFWDTILQPKVSNVDRNASTKINIDNKLFKRKILDYIKEDIKEENQENLEIKQKKIISKKNIKNIKRNINLKEENPKKVKNRALMPIDLPFYDLEPEKIPINEDNESIKLLRREYESKLTSKREKKEKEKKLDKQNNLIDNEEEITRKKKNLKTGSKIIKIKPIKIENLITEFKSLKSYLKEIEKIKEVNLETQIHNNKSNIKIELNENPIFKFDDEKTERKRKKYNYQNINNLNNNKKIEKVKENENFEKNEAKYASGSNYNLIKLECGVNLIENRKKKSGGKNYFAKYGRYSYDLYQNKLNKTTSENFIENEYKEIINDSFKEDKIRTKKEIISEKVLIKKKSNCKINFENIDIEEHLNTKTKNLKIVMNNLDLTKDFKLNMEQYNKNMKNTKYNFFKTKINNKSFNRNKKDLREINNFNKTVMKNNLWGEPNNSSIKEDYQKPLHFYHHLKNNIRLPFIGLKRERLPPILSVKYHQIKDIKTERNKSFEKLKIKNLSKENIYINGNKSFYI